MYSFPLRPQIIIMSSILKGIQRIVEEQVSSILYDLSDKYGFCYDEEYEAFLAKFTLSNKTQKIKQPKPLKEKTLKQPKPLKEKTLKEKPVPADKSPKWKLPFNGTINPSLCHAICRADGLYIQCKKTHLDDSDLCKTCQNYMLKNEKLPCGRIEERVEHGLYDFRFGKYAPLPYSIYMKKHDLSRETVEEYAATLGITLDEQHFVEVQQEDVPKKKGGRKPKSAIQVVNVTNDNDEDDIRAIMDDIFQVHSEDSESDSESDSDSGLQFSKKSNKSPPTKKHAKKNEPVVVIEPEPVVVIEPEPVVTKESTVTKETATKETVKKTATKETVKKTATKETTTAKKSKKTDKEPVVAKESTTAKESEPVVVIEPEHVKEPVVTKETATAAKKTTTAAKKTTTKESAKKSKKTDKEPTKEPVIEPEHVKEPVVTKETATKKTTDTKKTTKEPVVTKETATKKTAKKSDKEPVKAIEPVHVKEPVSKETDTKETAIELVHTNAKQPAKEIQVTGLDGQIWTIPVEPIGEQPVKAVTVKKLFYNGVKYLRNSADNSIFDMEHNHVGTFDPATQVIIFFEDEDEDDEDDDEEDDEEE